MVLLINLGCFPSKRLIWHCLHHRLLERLLPIGNYDNAFYHCRFGNNTASRFSYSTANFPFLSSLTVSPPCVHYSPCSHRAFTIYRTSTVRSPLDHPAFIAYSFVFLATFVLEMFTKRSVFAHRVFNLRSAIVQNSLTVQGSQLLSLGTLKWKD